MPTYSKVLKNGSKGTNVKYMQECLIALGYSCGSSGADGIFGSGTETAVKNYQKSHKDTSGKALSVDGKIGSKTWKAIERDYNNLNSSYSASYSRLLKKTSPLMKGEDVKFVQQKLVDLGYDIGNSGVDGQYGNDTVSAVKEFQKDYGLSVDGIVGSNTWNALEKATSNSSSSTVKYTRVLKQGMSGNDVRYMKDCLFALNYYTSNIKKITNNTFGNDTVKAVKLYQQKNTDTSGKALSVDGKIGEKTWGAVERDYKAGKKNTSSSDSTTSSDLTKDEFPNLADKTIKDLNSVWSGISSTRKELMKLCLAHAYDTVNGSYKSGDHLVGMYIIGANLYDTKLELFHPTSSYIKKTADSKPSYFNGGREDFMLKELEHNSNIAASDCSGMIVGAMRKLKLVATGFDTTANNFCSNSYSTSVSKNSLKPGDWVGLSGHIGVYLGADMVVEFTGGAYGCQVTKFSKRQARNMMTGKLENMSAWTKYRRPKYY